MAGVQETKDKPCSGAYHHLPEYDQQLVECRYFMRPGTSLDLVRTISCGAAQVRAPMYLQVFFETNSVPRVVEVIDTTDSEGGGGGPSKRGVRCRHARTCLMHASGQLFETCSMMRCGLNLRHVHALKVWLLSFAAFSDQQDTS